MHVVYSLLKEQCFQNETWQGFSHYQRGRHLEKSVLSTYKVI